MGDRRQARITISV